MPADYTSSINLREGRQIVVSGFCRGGERRLSLRIGNEVVFMSEVEAITLIREITMALSRTCRDREYRDRGRWGGGQQKQQQAQKHGQAQAKQLSQQSHGQTVKKNSEGMEAGKIVKI